MRSRRLELSTQRNGHARVDGSPRLHYAPAPRPRTVQREHTKRAQRSVNIFTQNAEHKRRNGRRRRFLSPPWRAFPVSDSFSASDVESACVIARPLTSAFRARGDEKRCGSKAGLWTTAGKKRVPCGTEGAHRDDPSVRARRAHHTCDWVTQSRPESGGTGGIRIKGARKFITRHKRQLDIARLGRRCRRDAIDPRLA